MHKIRASLVYLNARRYGLPTAEAMQCAREWQGHMQSLFVQSKAAQVYSEANFSLDGFEELPKRTLYVTAHYSAYTAISINLGLRFRRPVNIVVGRPPKEFEETLVSELGKVGVEGKIITSGFSMLKKLKAARDNHEVMISLCDVPWHRLKLEHRDFEFYPFGNGEIRASKAIFDMASRVELDTRFVLCHPNGENSFVVRDHGPLSMPECFAALNRCVAEAPSHYERFCELNAYYRQPQVISEVICFHLKGHRYLMSTTANKAWRLSRKLSQHLDEHVESERYADADALVHSQWARTGNRTADAVAYI